MAHAGARLDDPAATRDEAYAAVASSDRATRGAHIESSPLRVAVPLQALDGETVGVLAAAPTSGRRFTELDHALLVHVGQMAAAALERAMRYRRGT